MRYLIVLIIVLTSGCANNWLNLKQSEFLLKDDDPTKPLYRNKSDLPIVTYHTLLGEESLNAYTQAVNIINKAGGCEIFRQPRHTFSDPQRAIYLKCWNRVAENDFIWPDEDLDNEDLGLCISSTSLEGGAISESTVYIPCYRPFPETQLQVAVHEMLHTLGIGHDRELGTVMYHDYKFASMEIQEADLNILRNYYCGKATFKEVNK